MSIQIMCYHMIDIYFIFYLKSQNHLMTHVKYVSIYTFKLDTNNFIANYW